MPNVVPFPNQSLSVPRPPHDTDQMADLVGGASRLIGESKRCREFILQAFEQLDAAERRAASVEDEATRSALLGILAEKRKSLTILDRALTAELQSFCTLSSEID